MSIHYDSLDLMRQLAKMAKIDLAPITRMVLVLEVDEIPRLLVESQVDKGVELGPAQLEVETGPLPDVIDLTSIQNKVFKTQIPRPEYKNSAGQTIGIEKVREDGSIEIVELKEDK